MLNDENTVFKLIGPLLVKQVWCRPWTKCGSPVQKSIWGAMYTWQRRSVPPPSMPCLAFASQLRKSSHMASNLPDEEGADLHSHQKSLHHTSVWP